jgi:hypothetical protein
MYPVKRNLIGIKNIILGRWASKKRVLDDDDDDKKDDAAGGTTLKTKILDVMFVSTRSADCWVYFPGSNS